MRRARGTRRTVLFRGLLGLASAGALGCENPSPPPTSGETDPHEPSPNAQILPSPLAGSRTSAVPAASAAQLGANEPALVVTTLPVDRPLRDEVLLPAATTGFEFVFSFQAFDGERPRGEGTLARARADLRVELASPSTDPRSHQRVVLDGALFVLPENTELRSRSDRHGWVIVWPDGRSYRVVPRNALGALFDERRVDVMPAFEVKVEVGEKETIGERTREKRRWTSPIGSVDLAFVSYPELGEATLLFCDVLLEFLRVRRTQATCVAGELPESADFTWKTGGKWRGVLIDPKKRSDLDPSHFLVPPVMPIFKPGELPPDDASPWTPAEFRKLFATQKEPFVQFENTLDVPLLLSIDGVPALRLDPAESLPLALPRPGAHYAARDFLGQTVLPGGPVTAPVTVRLGASPEIQPTGAPSANPPSP